MAQFKITLDNFNDTITMLQTCCDRLVYAENCIKKTENALAWQSNKDITRILFAMRKTSDKVNDVSDDIIVLQKLLIELCRETISVDKEVYGLLMGTTGRNPLNKIANDLEKIWNRVEEWIAQNKKERFTDATSCSTECGDESHTHVLVLNDDGNDKQEIEVVETSSFAVENSVIKLYIPGIGEISLDEYPVDSKYPNSYTVVINGVETYLAGAQCLGFARYVHEKIYGDHHIYGEEDSFTRNYYNIARGTLDAETFKQLIMQNGVGAHIRTNAKTDGGWGHSMVVAEITNEGLTIIDANGDGAGTVAVNTYTWDEYMSKWGGRGIEYIETYNG